MSSHGTDARPSPDRHSVLLLKVESGSLVNRCECGEAITPPGTSDEAWEAFIEHQESTDRGSM